MDRIQAKKKINKLLRLANDKGATESERDTALEMANKLASKFSFKIQRGTPSQHSQEVHNPANYTWKPSPFCYSFELNCFNKKFVSFILGFFGVKMWSYFGKKGVCFDSYLQFNIDEFKKFYKKFVSVYYKTKKEVGRGLSEAEYFDTFCYYFSKGALRMNDSNEYYAKVYKLGKEFFDKKNTIAH